MHTQIKDNASLTFSLRPKSTGTAGGYLRHLLKGTVFELILEVERVPIIEQPMPRKGA